MKNAQLSAAALILAVLLLAGPCPAETTLIPGGGATTWRYYDKNTEPQTQWYKADFDDASWASGAAPLGYGENALGTTVSIGADPLAKNMTAYFRTSFEVAEPKAFSEVRFLIRSDDGIVVYVNGTEVIRKNMPAGDVSFTTAATADLKSINERFYRKYSVDVSKLVPGKNVLAVEVHQADAKSDDLYLDLSAKSYNVGEDTKARMSPAAKEAAEAYRYKHIVPPEMKIPDGYVDGGRSMKLEEDGRATSGREIIVLDRQKDESLKEMLKWVKSEELQKLEPLERAKVIGRRVVAEGDYNMSRAVVTATEYMVRDWKGEPIYIGDITKICGAGVCRHRSLLFKVLGDDAGLKTALVRGNFGGPDGAHAWNELILDDGKRYIIDCMHEPVDILIPESRADKYLTVANKPWYNTTPKPPPEKK